MRYRDDLELAAQRTWTVEAPPRLAPKQPRLRVTVVFTSAAATPGALKRAAELAAQLSADITLLVPQVVPFPLPLGSPPVLLGFNERRFRALAEQSGVDTEVRIFLCRDRELAIQTALSSRSLVVVGVRRQWWFSSEMRLARKLRRQGHEVVITEVGKQ